jgi:hypothetical protein
VIGLGEFINVHGVLTKNPECLDRLATNATRTEGRKRTVADSWQAKLRGYTFDVDVLPLSQGADTGSELFNYFDLLCTVTDWKTGATHKISVIDSPRFRGSWKAPSMVAMTTMRLR